ncbi:MAG: plastocyanin/azurin family copper-binding protein [Candidatus Limnocylindrales bacterium]
MSTRAATLTGPRAALRFGWMGVVGVSLALGGAFGLAHRSAAQEPLVVTAGGSDGTALVQAYLPGALTVETGTSVEFLVGSGVPQTVTLGEGPADIPARDWPVSGWSDLVGDSVDPVEMGLVSWGGSGFLNTGPMPVGSTASVRFDAPGTFEVESVVSPGMTALVTVVEAGTAPVTTLDEANAAAEASLEDLLGRADALRESRAASVEAITASDGTTTWNIFADAASVAGPLPGGGTGYLELLEFAPRTLVIAPGDTVHWTALGRHSVTFPALGQDPSTIDPETPATTAETYDGSRLATSGELNAVVGSPSGFTLTFPTAGTFDYVCLDHQAAGHVGTIQVGETTTSPSAAPASPAPAG